MIQLARRLIMKKSTRIRLPLKNSNFSAPLVSKFKRTQYETLLFRVSRDNKYARRMVFWSSEITFPSMIVVENITFKLKSNRRRQKDIKQTNGEEFAY